MICAGRHIMSTFISLTYRWHVLYISQRAPLFPLYRHDDICHKRNSINTDELLDRIFYIDRLIFMTSIIYLGFFFKKNINL